MVRAALQVVLLGAFLLASPAGAGAQDDGPVTSVAFVGSRVAVGFHDGTITAYRIPGGLSDSELTVLTIADWSSRAHRARVASIAVTDSTLISGSWDRTVRVLDTCDGHQLSVFPVGGPVESVSLVDGQRVAFAERRSVALLDLSTGSTRGVHSDSGGRVLALAVSPTTRSVVSGGKSREAHLFRIEGNEETRVLQHPDTVGSVFLVGSPESVVTTCWDGQVRLWPSQGSQPDTFRAHDTQVTAACMEARTGILVTAGLDRNIRVWSLHDKRLVREISLTAEHQHALALAISRDAGLLVIGTARRHVLAIKLEH